MNGIQAKTLNSRVNRVSGQIGGIRRMIDQNRHCVDILDQIAASRKAKRFGQQTALEAPHQVVL